MRDTDSMTQPLVRTPLSLEDLQEGDLIVAYYDDDALQNDDAVLGGAILLRKATSLRVVNNTPHTVCFSMPKSGVFVFSATEAAPRVLRRW